MGKKSKIVVAENGVEVKKRKHAEEEQISKVKVEKIKEETDSKCLEVAEGRESKKSKKSKKQKTEEREDSILEKPKEVLNDELSKEKIKKEKKKRGKSPEPIDKSANDDIENYPEKKMKSKKQKRKKEREEADPDLEKSEVKEDTIEEGSKKKKKKEKPKRDKSLDAFNDLKSCKEDGENDDAVETDQYDNEDDQKKTKKKNKKVKSVDHIHETKGHSRALKYLDAWNDSANGKKDSGWKFEKCRQNWLVSHAYDKDRIPDSKFDVLLKYLNSIKGKMRGEVLGTAKQKLELEEKWSVASESGKTDSVDLPVEKRPKEKEVERAKEIVMMLEDN